VYLRTVPEAVAAAGASAPADLPAGPPFFQYAADAEFAMVLTDAGLAEPVIETVEFVHRIADLDPFWEDLIGGTVRVNALVSSQDAETRARIRAAYEGILKPYHDADGFTVPCVVKVGAAVRPA